MTKSYADLNFGPPKKGWPSFDTDGRIKRDDPESRDAELEDPAEGEA